MLLNDMQFIAVAKIEPIQLRLLPMILRRRVPLSVIGNLFLFRFRKRFCSPEVFQDAPVDLIQVIALAQLVEAEEALGSRRFQAGVLQPIAVYPISSNSVKNSSRVTLTAMARSMSARISPRLVGRPSCSARYSA